MMLIIIIKTPAGMAIEMAMISVSLKPADAQAELSRLNNASIDVGVVEACATMRLQLGNDEVLDC